jgi:hypothetical protein
VQGDVGRLLMELEEKLLKWIGHVERMDRTRTLRKALKIKCRGKRPMG